jgi:RNA polymerase-binding transcription factor DksA
MASRTRKTGDGRAADGAAPPPRPRRPTLSRRDLRAFRSRLEAELAELTGQQAELEQAANAATADAAAEVGFDEDFVGSGTSTFERERDLSLIGNTGDLIDKVRHALARLDDGSFGRCEACGEPIGAERLDALPYTTLCLADARRRSRPR